MERSGQFRWGLVGVGVLAAGLVSWGLLRKEPERALPPRPTPVAVEKVALRDVPVSINALGAAQAWQSVVVRPQISGRLVRVAVQEGTDVPAGGLIAEIDPAPFRAQLAQAEGALRRDQASLDLARLNLNRYRQLLTQDYVARQQVDTLEAEVKRFEGAVQTNQGAVAAARVNLGYTRIVAPVAGRVGVHRVDAGNIVSSNDQEGIVVINQINPIAVTFTVPQGEFQRLWEVSDAFRKPLMTEALSQETGALLGVGALSIADNGVDPSTGTVQLKARFPNEGRRLIPGQMLNVRLTLNTLKNAIAIPSAAVNQGPEGPYAYVVEPSGDKVAMRTLDVLLTQGPVTVVRSGVQPGDTVVTEGQLSLKPGAAVRVRGAPGAPGGPAQPRAARP